MERGVTAKRWTFLISKTGKLLYKNTNVSASKDSETVLQFLKREKI
jgi:peroxiredoxin Q/BCP